MFANHPAATRLRRLAQTAVLLLLCSPAAQLTAGEIDSECMDCHEGELAEPLNSSWHLLRSGSRAAEPAQCTNCHGDSADHRDDPEENSPDVLFDSRRVDPDLANAACQSCHDGDNQTWWTGSTHDDQGMICADCHTVHSSHNRTGNRLAQVDFCGDCHTDVRSASRLRTHHPIAEGKTVCTDCHNPHGSGSDAMLATATLNDTCYNCHAEKRGPFLFEHEPVTEDCTNCHSPHGSINDALLTARTPFLCQQCHSAAFHPSQLHAGDGLPQTGASEFLLGKNCLNCHSQVHGSNHPSGARMTR